MKMRDYTSCTINGFKVLGRSSKIKGKTYWRVLCPCGKPRPDMRIDSLQKHTGRCTCPLEVGITCGMLTYLNREEPINGRARCKVRCNCGKVYSTDVSSYKRNKKGCGTCPNTYKIDGAITYLDISTNKHPNTFCSIDTERYESIKHMKWCAIVGSGGKLIYVQASDGKDRILLHRYLLDCPSGLVVDHINGDTLNNTLANLRVGNCTMNSRNTKTPSNNKSGRIGVFETKNGSWIAYIGDNNKTDWLGTYSTFEDACDVRRSAEIEYGYHPNHGRA